MQGKATMSVENFKEQFDKYLTLYGKQRESRKAIEWLRRKVHEFAPKASLEHDAVTLGKAANTMIPGKFYLYGYDPKWKDVLPIFDTVPYVLITEMRIGKPYFKGINFHYIPRDLRVEFFSHLYEIAGNHQIRGGYKDGKIYQAALEIARVVDGIEPLKEAHRNYLYTHVKTRPITIHKDDWALTSFLPLARMYTNKKKK